MKLVDGGKTFVQGAEVVDAFEALGLEIGAQKQRKADAEAAGTSLKEAPVAGNDDLFALMMAAISAREAQGPASEDDQASAVGRQALADVTFVIEDTAGLHRGLGLLEAEAAAHLDEAMAIGGLAGIAARQQRRVEFNRISAMRYQLGELMTQASVQVS